MTFEQVLDEDIQAFRLPSAANLPGLLRFGAIAQRRYSASRRLEAVFDHVAA
jgi:hypothetical protein